MAASVDPLAEIRAGFFAECEDLLGRLDDALADPSIALPGSEPIHAAFRAVHTIKGGAASLSYQALAETAHIFESRLDRLRSADHGPDAGVMAAMQALADDLAQAVERARTAGPTGDAAGCEPDPAALGNWRIVFRPAAALYQSGNEALHLINALTDLGEASVSCDAGALPSLDTLDPQQGYLSWTIDLAGSVDERAIRETFEFVEDICDLRIERLTEASPPPTETAANRPDDGKPQNPEFVTRGAAPERPTVRVDLDRFDRLMNLVGELAIAEAILARRLRDAGLDRRSAAAAALKEVQTLGRDLQDSVLALRTQPVKPLFQRMARILREAAARAGKPARLHLVGETTEIDRSIAERLVEPLTHMIRNAVDHGLEDSARRAASGKPAEGQITLSAAHRSGRVIVELADDGGGIDRARVRATALAKGLIAPDAALTEAETDALLFRPGFSTAQTVGALSGRGVGMDAVQTAVAALGGRLSLWSEPGRGTRLSLSLPLTLAVMEAMLVRAGGHVFALPLAATLEATRLGTPDLDQFARGERLVRLRQRQTPLFDAAGLLGLGRARPSAALAVILADEADRRLALIVDELLGQSQIVVKPFGAGLGRVPGAAAATILGDGTVALILDPGELIDLAAATDWSAPPPERLAS
ncbi:chemotaxis protein CheA [Frigidibacter sp. RF13]|uniref:chemotaxis protein CheA n=1 Tax=Frigidibacter sp. RF13 TaxID=2997340 RepID=UPI0022717302|nr:chemotaxis protein CheA [Frigidibacter sp. RF13]MCY1125365.1 chemotaxis protein CheA [Frigidibacter sp. RF13]